MITTIDLVFMLAFATFVVDDCIVGAITIAFVVTRPIIYIFYRRSDSIEQLEVTILDGDSYLLP